MDTSTNPTDHSTRAFLTGDVRDMLTRLQKELQSGHPQFDAGDHLGGISKAVGSLCEEHAGMIEELLSVYEQLGIVFEVTRALPGTETEWEVLEVFLHNLQRSFPHCKIGLYGKGPDGYLLTHGVEAANVTDIDDHIRRAIEIYETRVCRVDVPGAAEIMVSPIMSGRDLIGALVLTRHEQAPEFRASDMSVIGSLSLFCGDLVRNQRLMEELRSLSGTLVQALVNAIDQKDEYTAGHSTRVAFYAEMLGRAMMLNAREQRMLQWSALLHDVGKIGIRDSVLKKKGPLTNEEFDHMKEHPVRSHEVVKEVAQLAGALDGVRYHHERYDGRGYPTGLSGQNIPLQARIVQVADVFDALTSNRSYRDAFSWQKALRIMEEEAGGTLDPNLQIIFDKLIRDRLETGLETWEGMVARGNKFTADWDLDLSAMEEH